MLPTFGDEHKRKINLGGTGSASSSSAAAILSRVQAERQARAEMKMRIKAAVRIQACWRGCRERGRVRAEVRRWLVGGDIEMGTEGMEGVEKEGMRVEGVRALRGVVMVGRDEDVLGRWAGEVVRRGVGALWAPSVGEKSVAESWMVLIRQVGVLLLREVADSPQCVYFSLL